MNSSVSLLVAILSSCLLAIGCATPRGEVYEKFTHDIRHLGPADSVEIQAIIPAVVQGQEPGTMVVFFPFRPLSDTLALRQTAVALLHSMRADFDSSRAPFVVLRAVNLRAASRTGAYQIENVGFVFQRVKGNWVLDTL
jgi:hypothetical protein